MLHNMADLNGNKIYALDFDGTLSMGADWPAIGQPNEPLFHYMIAEQAAGARMILYTCRNGKDLEHAIHFCKKNGLEFDAINENLPELIELYGGDTRKINADYYIDDKALNPIKEKEPERLAFEIYLTKIKNKLKQEIMQ